MVTIEGSNLKEVMKKYKVSEKDIAETLNRPYSEVVSKISGETRWLYDECIMIRETFFPWYEMRHLFRYRASNITRKRSKVRIYEVGTETDVIVSTEAANIPERLIFDIWKKPYFDHITIYQRCQTLFQYLRETNQKLLVLEGDREKIKKSRWADIFLF